jgi:1-acyl-sn-glycerol-3-phosphate acyltransferase
MGDFKKGAFSVAAKLNVPVVPITLDGTGPLMPNQREGELYPGRVRITVHPAIQSKDADALCDQSRKAVASCLPEELR